MACALTQNYTLDCKDSLGGITEVYFAASADITSTTEASGVITALVKAAGKKFFKYELVKGTSQLVENVNANVQNGTIFYAPELTIVLNKLQANTGTGTAEGDRSGYTLTFTGAEAALAPEVNSTVAGQLTTPGS